MNAKTQSHIDRIVALATTAPQRAALRKVAIVVLSEHEIDIRQLCIDAISHLPVYVTGHAALTAAKEACLNAQSI